MVEKPAPGTAPSNFFVNGRYILQPEIFSILASQQRGAGDEIQLTDAMVRLSQMQKFFGYHFTGQTYDTGMKEGYILANVAFALARPDIRSGVEADLKALLAALK
jgi:UTP--glucose-1-phosphate uridylyltransferase